MKSTALKNWKRASAKPPLQHMKLLYIAILAALCAIAVRRSVRSGSNLARADVSHVNSNTSKGCADEAHDQ